MNTASFKWSNLWSLLLLGFLMLFQSCVSEDELKFPDDTDDKNFTESVAIVSTLRAVKKQLLTNTNSFQFVYPLELQFNNDLQITVSDFSGLESLAKTLTASQHINAIEFPFNILKEDVQFTIRDENDFIFLLDDKGIPTMRDEFDPFFTQCFDLVYPIKMYDVDSNEVTITSKDAYFDFERNQGFDKQPKFIYPIAILDYASEVNQTIETSFELFEAFDGCKRCPELFFRIDTLSTNRFLFVADFEEIDRVFSYGWYVNGDKVETDGIGVQGDNRFTESFPEGDFEICIRATLPEDDCFSGVEYCQTIVVDPCPSISYEKRLVADSTYEFIANFPAKDLMNYYWVISQNQNVSFTELEGPDGDNRLVYKFDFAGTYQVCIEAEPEGCTQALKFCTDVVIE